MRSKIRDIKETMMGDKNLKQYVALMIAAATFGLLIYGIGTGKIDSQVVVDLIKPIMEWVGM
jgi:hypothetical protein